MENYLYRFRSMRSLLGEFQELKSQSIYLAPLQELNDPMEGFKDIFWSGDDIVWKNLFRHYVQCLSYAYFANCIVQEEHVITWDMIPLHDVRPKALTDDLKHFLDEVLRNVFSHDEMDACVQGIAKRMHPVRRNELEFYLRNVHELVIPCIAQVSERLKLQPPFKGTKESISGAKSKLAQVAESTGLCNAVETEHPNQEHAMEQMFASANMTLKQIRLIDKYNGLINDSYKNKNFVFFDFPEGYVRNVEKLVYPVWYTACFTKDFQNSAVWGTYGDCHRGVCLKFKVKNNDGRLMLKLNRVCGWGTGGPSRGDVQQPLLPVEYQSKFVAIDFFRSLGSIPIPVVNRDWHRSEDGRVSICDFGGDFTEERRREFWKTFEASATTKLEDWAYEQEYRIVHFGYSIDYSDPKLRVAHYEFLDLEGIIFGINTKDEDKLAIMKIIDEKCSEHQRDDFKFYQAYYSHATGQIETQELRHLKVSLDKQDEKDVAT